MTWVSSGVNLRDPRSFINLASHTLLSEPFAWRERKVDPNVILAHCSQPSCKFQHAMHPPTRAVCGGVLRGSVEISGPVETGLTWPAATALQLNYRSQASLSFIQYPWWSIIFFADTVSFISRSPSTGQQATSFVHSVSSSERLMLSHVAQLRSQCSALSLRP